MISLFWSRSPFDRLIRLARGGAQLLDAPARDEIARFLLAQQQPDGGFRGPAGGSDLYYTLFALAALTGSAGFQPASSSTGSAGFQPTLPYLATFDDGESLDLVHLAALAVCRGTLGERPPRQWCKQVATRLEAFRLPDGGFADEADCHHGTPYGAYLAILAASALGIRLPQRSQAIAAARRCQARDGGYAGRPGAITGTVPATIAALILNAIEWHRPPRETIAWFALCQRGAAFAAAPDAPLPDLLSTATVLAANRLLRLKLPVAARATAAFVESCWHDSGGFGAVPEARPDAEYTFYALLALGALG